MKRILLTLSGLLMLAFTVSAQSSPLQIEEKKVPGGIEFYCHNSSAKTFEITFKLSKTKNIKGYSNPVKKDVPAKGSVLLLEITTFPGYSFSYSTGIMEKPSIAGVRSPKSKSSVTVPYTPEALTKGVILFDKTDCARCSFAGNYMVENKIPFTVLDISEDANNQLMWKVLNDQGFKGRSFQTPAIMVDGEISHSHKSLEKFLAQLRR